MPNYEYAKDNGDYYLSMGLTAEEVAKDYKITREDQDAFSLRSHQRAIKAIKEGYFKGGILPIKVKEIYVNEKNKRAERETIVDTDEGPRAETSLAGVTMAARTMNSAPLSASPASRFCRGKSREKERCKVAAMVTE